MWCPSERPWHGLCPARTCSPSLPMDHACGDRSNDLGTNTSDLSNMKKLLLLGALLVGATVGLQNSSDAHGGTYRGPGDTVPPGGGGGGGGGGPGTPGPGAPS